MSNKLKGQKTELTGAQIRDLLRQLGVSDRKFYFDTGFSEAFGSRLLRGMIDGDIPKVVEGWLILYIVDQVAREEKGYVELPLAEYGLTLLTPGLASADRPAR
jgi:hypothetical protein